MKSRSRFLRNFLVESVARDCFCDFDFSKEAKLSIDETMDSTNRDHFSLESPSL